jgi:exopolysaccharide biosynthesis polyprenyl glycosylphosphotransferase
MKEIGDVGRTILAVHVAGFAMLALFAWALGIPRGLLDSARFSVFSCAMVIGERWTLYAVLRWIRRRGRDVHHVCVVGDSGHARQIERWFALHPEWGMRVRSMATTPTLEHVLKNEVIDEVVIAVHPADLPSQSATVQLCRQYGLTVRVLLDTEQADIVRPAVESVDDQVLISAGAFVHTETAIIAKRLLDLLLALLMILVSLPAMLAVAVLVKLSSPGPIVFRQRRVGLHGRHFTLYKFRTMFHGSDALIATMAYRNVTKGPTFKDPSDPRITNVGRVLRRFSLDELPQLFNVLQGDMSLVGPRPLPIEQCASIVGEHRRRFAMKPGITCLWQVNGRSDIEFSQWMKYDLQYVDEWSLVLDAKLLFKTIPVVLSGRGSY